MVDEVKNEALQELSQESPQNEASEQVEESTEQHQETQAELNFKALRAEKEKMARENERLMKERDEAMRYAHEYQMSMRQQYQQPQQNYMDYNNLKPDDLVEAKYVQQEFKRMKEELEQTKQQMQTGIIEAQLKTRYTDFDNVVTKENLSALKESHPDIHQTIFTSPDLYAKGSTAYKLIKELVLSGKEAPNYAVEQRKIAQNAAKPRNINTIKGAQTNSPLDKANSFATGDNTDPNYRKEVYKHMEKHAATHNIPFRPIG